MEQMDVRVGKLRFRGWQEIDEKQQPIFQQKGVDMMIGLDVALIATRGIADVIVLVTADTDFVEPLRLARSEGVITCLCCLHERDMHVELMEHGDDDSFAWIPNPGPRPGAIITGHLSLVTSPTVRPFPEGDCG
ncbi:MAG: NYN domain-containing protein [Candidatus Kapabacteria bacterium]|nr:NYN domain-containing protein [Candidatus Kapabacteria bacterium]